MRDTNIIPLFRFGQASGSGFLVVQSIHSTHAWKCRSEEKSFTPRNEFSALSATCSAPPPLCSPSSLPPSSRFPWRNKSIFRQILLRPPARPPFVSERERASKRGGMSRVSLVNYLHVLPFLHSPTPPLLLVAMLGREGKGGTG